ncbi:MAG: HlyD family efflux transporter periplasmic adaptor subunit [Rubrivivax sp.]|nr:HlyD family efflux transporter periplasmic adaptor subunit [Rubrivivax sp.]
MNRGRAAAAAATAAAVATAALLAAACRPAPPAGWSGYVEGQFVHVAAPLAGTLTHLAVRRGDRVAAGAALFTLDADAERAAREEALARLASARAQAANTTKGRRSDEVAMVRAQLVQAQEQVRLAAAELERQQPLVTQGFQSPARLDDLRTALAQARARADELQAALRVAQLPARSDERAAADAAATAASAAVAQARWREQQKAQTAPLDATVADTFYRVGEWVAAGQPVLALLPPAGLRARFFVPEGDIAGLAIGQPVTLRCDGCGETPIAARIDFIATAPEFTPPVIYSNSQRARLVFRVEARPLRDGDGRLKPGLPIDVQRAAS